MVFVDEVNVDDGSYLLNANFTDEDGSVNKIINIDVEAINTGGGNDELDLIDWENSYVGFPGIWKSNQGQTFSANSCIVYLYDNDGNPFVSSVNLDEIIDSVSVTVMGHEESTVTFYSGLYSTFPFYINWTASGFALTTNPYLEITVVDKNGDSHDLSFTIDKDTDEITKDNGVNPTYFNPENYFYHKDFGFFDISLDTDNSTSSKIMYSLVYTNYENDDITSTITSKLNNQKNTGSVSTMIYLKGNLTSSADNSFVNVIAYNKTEHSFQTIGIWGTSGFLGNNKPAGDYEFYVLTDKHCKKFEYTYTK